MHTSASAIAESRRPHAGKLSQASLLHQSDERLVTLARSGSERAWAEITRRYGRQLRHYCTRFVGASRAEDAVQQTFLQAFLSLRDGSHREIVLRAWLYRIAHNCSIDLLRKGTTDYDELDLEYDGVPQPPTVFEQREEVRRIVARMRDLPDAQRRALALRELEGRSYEEISAQLGHSGSGVRQLIFRARTALRNSAAALLPLGSHHVATAVTVPASSGTGMDVVGAATLAVVAVLGGGLAASDGTSREARRPPAQSAAVSPSPVAPSTDVRVPLAERAVRSAPFSARIPDRDIHASDADVTATTPLVPDPAAAVAPPVVAPPLPPAGDAPTPAADTQAPAGDEMREQSISTGKSTTPAASPGAGASPAPRAPSGTQPPAPGATTSPSRAAPSGAVTTTPPVPAGSGGPSTGTKPVPSKNPQAPSPPARKPAKGAPAKQPSKSPSPKSPSPKSAQSQKSSPKTAPKTVPPKATSPVRTSERG
jgi:RNA polymerase sigma factor (sigma-70 family)